MDQQKTGHFICELRKERGLTQRELAERLHMTDKAVSKWERGLSYPDITILSALSETLGVSERELLAGERQALPGSENAQPDLLVRQTLEYAKKTKRQSRFKMAAVFMVSYSAALIIGSFVCLLCDGILNDDFTWSLVVTVACVLAWAAVAPFFLLKARRIFWAAAAASVLTGGLLQVISSTVVTAAGWYPFPALAIFAASLAWVWLPILLHTFTRLQKWYVGAAAAFFGIPMNWIINGLSNGMLTGSPTALNLLQLLVNAVALFAVGLILVWMGRRKSRDAHPSAEKTVSH